MFTKKEICCPFCGSLKKIENLNISPQKTALTESSKQREKIVYKRYFCQECEREFDNNPIFQTIERLFINLTYEHCLFFYLRSQLEKLKSTICDSSNQETSELFSGSKVVFKDLIENQTNVSSPFLLAANFNLIGGSDHIKAIDNLIYWNSAKYLSQSFEQFETYLKDVASRTLNINKGYLNYIKGSDYKNYKKISFNSNDHNDWRIFISDVLKNSINILKFLKKAYPEIRKLENHNYRNIDLHEWLEVFSEARHTITHSGLYLNARRVQSWNQSKKNILALYFSGNYNGEQDYILRITKHNLYENFKLIAEYSFLVYKCWSIVENFEWDYFEKMNA